MSCQTLAFRHPPDNILASLTAEADMSSLPLAFLFGAATILYVLYDAFKPEDACLFKNDVRGGRGLLKVPCQGFVPEHVDAALRESYPLCALSCAHTCAN